MLISRRGDRREFARNGDNNENLAYASGRGTDFALRSTVYTGAGPAGSIEAGISGDCDWKPC